MVGASDSRLREAYPVLPCRILGSIFTLHCSTSLSCTNDYLTIDSGGYL